MEKIQKVSKVAYIIAKIFNVLVLISIIGVFIAMIAMLCLPKDLVTLKSEETSTISVDFKTVIDNFKEVVDNKDKIIGEIEKGDDDVTATISDDAVLSINEVETVSNVTLTKLGFSMIGLIIYLIGAYVVLLFICRLTSSLKKGRTPFCEENIKLLKTIGFSLIGFAIVPSFVGSILYSILNIGQKFQISYVFNFNFTTILVGVLFVAVIYIFEYGIKLQKDSDEIL